MAMNDATPLTPKIPDVASLDFSKVVFSYDQEADTLVVHFYGRDREAEVVPGDGWVDLRVDPDTYEVIGLQIEGYLSDAIFAAPRLIGLAALAGISSADIEHLRMQWAISEALPSDEALLTA